jgi:hypothetical protein
MRPLILALLAAILLVPAPAKAQEDPGAIVKSLRASAASVPTPPAEDYKVPLYVQDDGWTVYTVPDPPTAIQVRARINNGGAPKEGETVGLAKGETIKILGPSREYPDWVQVEVNRQEYKDGKVTSNTKGWVNRPIPSAEQPNPQPAGLAGNVPAGSKVPLEIKDLPANECRAAFIKQLNGFQGVPYVWGGTSHNGVDCSGLVAAALMEAGCVRGVPRTAADQQQAAVPLSGPDKLQPGDLIFEGARAHHVYVYYGQDSSGNKIIEAMMTGTVVTIKGFRPGTTYGALLPQ